MKKKLLAEAQAMFGTEIVNTVMEMVEMVGDPDSVYSAFRDYGQDEEADCTEFLYFENE